MIFFYACVLWLWACHGPFISLQMLSSQWFPVRATTWILRLMFDRNPVPEVSSGRPIVGVFVDNICVVGEKASDDVLSVKNNIVAYAKRVKIPVTWSYDVAVSVFESVGVVLDLGLKESETSLSDYGDCT